MAERRVDVRFSSPGFDEVVRNFEKLSLIVDKFGLQLDKLSLKMDKLSKKRIAPEFVTKGIDKANASLDKLDLRLDKLSHKRVTATVKVNVDNRALGKDLSRAGGLFSRMFSRGGGGGDNAAGAAASAAGSGGGSAGGAGLAGLLASLGGVGIAGLIASAVATASALIPAGLGLGVGGAGALGAYKLNPKPFQATINQAKNAYLNAISNKPNGIFGGQPNLLPGVGEHGMPGPQGSFLNNIVGILAQIDKFIQSIGPGLRSMFMASLPVVRSFVSVMEQFAKAALPAITQSLQQLKSSGALKILTQSFVILVKSLASFITELGPGMKDSAIIFKTLMIIVAAAVRLAGKAVSLFAQGVVDAVEGAKIFAHNTAKVWDQFRSETARLFDDIRHNVAHVWDSMFNDTLGTTIRNGDRIMVDLARFGHNIASGFDQTRHAVVTIWDQFWSEVERMVSDGIHNVLAYFDRLPAQIGHLLSNLGSMLRNIATTAMHDFLTGLTAVGGTILSWIKNFFAGIPHDIMSILHMSPPHPGSVFYDLGANFMHHVQAGMQSRARSVAAAAHGIAGGTAAAYAHSLANRIGWGGQWGFINDVAMRESGWSMTARNPSSGAYGIAQFINGPSEYYQYGGNPNTVSGQVIAFFNYIRQRYGSPAAAWAHELNFGWYDAGGRLPPGLSLALNTTGHDEIHTHGGSGGGGGDVYNIFALDESYSDEQAIRLIQKVRRYKTRHGNQPTGIG